MMGARQPQPNLFHTVQLEDLVPQDHPLRKILPLIDIERIRKLCEPFYSDEGRPSIPPEQLFLAMLGGYLLGRALRPPNHSSADQRHGLPLVRRLGHRLEGLGRHDVLEESRAPVRRDRHFRDALRRHGVASDQERLGERSLVGGRNAGASQREPQEFRADRASSKPRGVSRDGDAARRKPSGSGAGRKTTTTRAIRPSIGAARSAPTQRTARPRTRTRGSRRSRTKRRRCRPTPSTASWRTAIAS